MLKNKHALAHLPMVFIGKISQVFQHIASFSQSSINMNKVELNKADYIKKKSCQCSEDCIKIHQEI
jgi:hypothetical protein